MKPAILNTIHLINANGELLAEYLVLGNPDDNSVIPWVKCIPFYGMHEMYRTDIGNPLIVQAGMIMPAQSFLGYIGQIVRNSRHHSYPMEMSSQGEHYLRIKMIQPMNAKEIAELTQFPIELVRDYYRDNFIMDVDNVK